MTSPNKLSANYESTNVSQNTEALAEALIQENLLEIIPTEEVLETQNSTLKRILSSLDTLFSRMAQNVDSIYTLRPTNNSK